MTVSYVQMWALLGMNKIKKIQNKDNKTNKHVAFCTVTSAWCRVRMYIWLHLNLQPTVPSLKSVSHYPTTFKLAFLSSYSMPLLFPSPSLPRNLPVFSSLPLRPSDSFVLHPVKLCDSAYASWNSHSSDIRLPFLKQLLVTTSHLVRKRCFVFP